MSDVIKVEGLVKRYKELIALDHLDLKVKQGEIYGLLGPNGSGKTTAINCILSLLEYDKGTVTVFGKEMTPRSYDIKKDIGIVPQDLALYDSLTVYENIDFFCGLYIKDPVKRKQYVQEAIDFVAIGDFVKFKPKKLSGGLKRRLNIACGIAHKPKLIFFDEPMVAVDPQSRNKILEGIVELRNSGATVVYTSHYMEEVEQICDYVVILDKGNKIAEGTIDDLKNMIKKSEIITIEAAGVDEDTLESIREMKNIFSVNYENDLLIVEAGNGKHNVIDIINILQDKGYMMKKIFSEQPTLNDVFLELTGKNLRDE
ncbi:MAG: ABC transporter ATP-binding protein [Clostridiales bacterium]|nr:ABC transporter ATP-binding protein [Clostridiales bacterium]